MFRAVRKLSSSAATRQAGADLLPALRASQVKSLHKASAYFLAAGIPAAFLCGGGVADVVDGGCIIAVPLHSYVGLKSVMVDYMPHLGVTSASAQRALLTGLSAFTVLSALGLLKMTVGEMGFTRAVRKFWVLPAANEER